MREWQILSHVRWYCRYQIMIVPKYRKKAIFGLLRKAIGGIRRAGSREYIRKQEEEEKRQE